jgi:hypothetical protein
VVPTSITWNIFHTHRTPARHFSIYYVWTLRIVTLVVFTDASPALCDTIIT